ncbi:MAG: AAA family ATPase [Burkholderiales bacterium]
MELLADRDPEEARAILDPVLGHMMDAVHAYEGTVNQVMGDGIMALFGAPLSQEDHAVRACYAALRMQSAIHAQSETTRAEYGVSIQARVGINSGEVLVRSIGSDLKMDYSAVGQTTHLAARMEQLAAGGTTLITPDTLHLVEGFVQVKSLGPVAVKGMKDRLEVFELISALTRRSRLQARAASGGLTQFVGRQHEFEVLADAENNAKDGKGQVVATVGEPGVGKSRLFWEFTHSHHTQGCMVVEASSVSYGKATSFLPVIDLLKSYFQIGERDDARSVKEKLTGKLLTLDRHLETVLSPILALLDQPVEDAQWQQLEPPQRRRQTLDALKQLWLREAQNQPLVLVFEDLHWIDSETQTFLNELLEKIPATQILLLFNYRPEYQHPWGNKTFYTQLGLDPLSTESAQDLLQSLLGNDPSVQALKPSLIEHTEGNPLFLEESVRALVETGQLLGDKGAYRAEGPLSTSEVPPTVQALLAARIDRLDAEDKRLLQTASVIGKDVPFELLKAIAETDDEELNNALARLQAAEFVYEAGLYPDVEYTFKHALTHEVAYGGLTQERKRAIHAQIVEAIEHGYANRLEEHIERLAHHALRGDVWDKAVRYLRQAGQRAFARSANAESVKWWEQALEATEHLPEGIDKTNLQIDIRLDLRAPLVLMGELAIAGPMIADARSLAEKANDRYRTARSLAYEVQARFFSGKVDEAFSAGERAAAISEANGYEDVQIVASVFLPHIMQWKGKLHDSAALSEAGLKMIASFNEDQRFGVPALPAVYSRGVFSRTLILLGHFSRGLDLLSEARTIAQRTSQPYSQAWIANLAAGVLLERGNFEEATKEAEQALALSKAVESWALYPWSAAHLGLAYALGERGPEGLELLDDSIQRFEETDGFLGKTYANCLLSEAQFQFGNIEKSALTAQNAEQAVRKLGIDIYAPMLRELLGRIHLHPDLHQPLEAKDCFMDSLRLAKEQGNKVTIAHCHAGFGRLNNTMGKEKEATNDLTRACEMYRDMGMTYYLRKAEHDLATLA